MPHATCQVNRPGGMLKVLKGQEERSTEKEEAQVWRVWNVNYLRGLWRVLMR